MRIGIVGTGSVGQALARGFARNGQEVRFGSRHPAGAEVPSGMVATSQREASAWAEVVVLAVPYGAVKEAVDAIGPDALRGKVLVDPTNAVRRSGLIVGFTTSAAEELAKLAPGARVVKAFNTVFAGLMATGATDGEAITVFVAGDDEEAKATVIRLGREIGFDAVDAGPLKSARYVEPMAIQMMILAYHLDLGPGVALRLVGPRGNG